MSRTRTLSELRGDVEDAADLPASGSNTFVTTSMLNRWINQSVRRYMALLVRAYGQDFFRTTSSISIVSGTTEYDLPSDFYQLLYVRAEISGNRMALVRSSIDSIDIEDHASGWDVTRLPRYRLLGNKIVFTLEPTGAHTVDLAYVGNKVAFNSGGTAQADLSADTDYVEGWNGWEDWIVYDAGIKARVREETDFSSLKMLRDELERDIISDAAMRDQTAPRVRNTYDRGNPWYLR